MVATLQDIPCEFQPWEVKNIPNLIKNKHLAKLGQEELEKADFVRRWRRKLPISECMAIRNQRKEHLGHEVSDEDISFLRVSRFTVIQFMKALELRYLLFTSLGTLLSLAIVHTKSDILTANKKSDLDLYPFCGYSDRLQAS